jgi:DNA-binding PadR family transcriptional regulator
MAVNSIDEFISDFSKFYILMLLHDRPLHGYRVISEFKKRVGKDISPGLVYPFLREIEKRGLVTCAIVSGDERKRKVYQLTREGRDVCKRFFRRFTTLVSTALKSGPEVCAHCGCKVYEGGYIEVVDGKETMFCCKHCANSYKKGLLGRRI